MSAVLRESENDPVDGAVQQFRLDQEPPSAEDSQCINYSIKFSASIFQQVLRASAGKDEEISIVFDSESKLVKLMNRS